MKRLALAALLAACGSSAPEPFDAAEPGSLTLLQPSVTVVRGESVAIPFTLEVFGLSTVHVEIDGLPSGLSASEVDWKLGDPLTQTITVTAAPDAPDAEIAFAVSATSGAIALPSAAGTLSVSDVVGSLDTSFGQGGQAHLQVVGLGITFLGMTRQQSGRWMLAGYSNNGGGPEVFPVLLRLLANGTIDPNFGANGIVEITPQDSTITKVEAVAFAPDDRVAMSLERASDAEVVTIDADGNLLGTMPLADAPIALAWDGDDVFAATASELERLDGTASPLSRDVSFSLAALQPNGPGAVVAFGRGPTGLARFVASSSAIAPDPTYGNAGFVGLPAALGMIQPTPFDVDASGRALVGLDTLAIARVLPSGVLDSTWGQAGLASVLGATEATPTFVRALSSGGAFVIGALSPKQSFVTMLDASGASVRFGTFGRTLLCDGCTSQAAAFDANETRACVVEQSITFDSVVACYRLAP
ncbi:MAG TPA: hypothetical protein VGH28_08095 [Polyangiaceae bacterium]